ncbi:unnamed protein product [Eretmochelys imbricata]
MLGALPVSSTPDPQLPPPPGTPNRFKFHEVVGALPRQTPTSMQRTEKTGGTVARKGRDSEPSKTRQEKAPVTHFRESLVTSDEVEREPLPRAAKMEQGG